MGRRKGELSRRMMDSGWPHQAAVTAETCRGDGYLTTHCFCLELSLCPRHWHYRREDRDYVVFCFADPAHAQLFRQRFGGVAVNRQRR
jgi:hypothetical protein